MLLSRRAKPFGVFTDLEDDTSSETSEAYSQIKRRYGHMQERYQCPRQRKCLPKVVTVSGPEEAASNKGVRPTMEDAHICAKIETLSTACVKRDKNNHVYFYAILDGHGGDESSNWLSLNLVPILTKYLNKERSVENAITRAFQEADESLLVQNFKSGSTCISILIEEATGTAWTANVGDSRCVFSNGLATVDHKASRLDEAERIKLAGGCIVNNRVLGLLSVTRAFGDKIFKPPVICTPEIEKITLNSEDHEFCILACDGLWDVMSNSLAITLCRDGFTIANSEAIGWSLVAGAIEHCKSLDNVSVLVLKFDY